MSSSARRVATSIDAGGKGGGKEPEIKRRRLLDAGGPIEDDETARRKMRDAEVYVRGVDGTYGEYAGFDPDNVADVKSFHWSDADADDYSAVKAMGYFAWKGDLLMMRWLYVNGADTRDKDVEYWFPMFLAAVRGHPEACKWLFAHGAAKDIKRRTRENPNRSPLHTTFSTKIPHKRDLNRWLILNGALCKNDDTGDLDVDLMKSSLNRARLNHFEGSAEERPELLKWAREHHQSRSSFDVVLMGTLSTPTYSAAKLRDALMARIGERAADRILQIAPPDQYRLLWDDLFPRRVYPLAAFSGKNGILELIGDYVDIMRGREARIIRQLTELLPGVIEELENRRHESSSDDSDESSDDSDH